MKLKVDTHTDVGWSTQLSVPRPAPPKSIGKSKIRLIAILLSMAPNSLSQLWPESPRRRALPTEYDRGRAAANNTWKYCPTPHINEEIHTRACALSLSCSRPSSLAHFPLPSPLFFTRLSEQTHTHTRPHTDMHTRAHKQTCKCARVKFRARGKTSV